MILDFSVSVAGVGNFPLEEGDYFLVFLLPLEMSLKLWESAPGSDLGIRLVSLSVPGSAGVGWPAHLEGKIRTVRAGR